MISRRVAIITAVFLVATAAIYHFRPWTPISSWPSRASDVFDGLGPVSSIGAFKPNNGMKESERARLNYFDQVFSVEKPVGYDFPGLRQYCERTEWPERDVYLKCGGMAAGLTSIISEVKVCFKMALETGSHLVLPSMPLRDSTDLNEYNLMHPENYLNYDQWFDGDHFLTNIQKACPKMKIVHPDKLDKEVPVKHHNWSVNIGDAPDYHFPDQYFWVGRPFKTFFNQQLAKLEEAYEKSPDRDDTKKGITVIDIHSAFLLFRITDDPTRQDLALWNDLSLLIRFTEGPRKIIDRLISRMSSRSFYGVHFRVEKDAIWSPLEHQLAEDLEALDKAWSKWGSTSQQKPLIYLACGDSEQVEKFVEAGKERGWEVTHKWDLAKDDKETLDMINELAFDFQGAIDFGVMVKSEFFLGLTGSAFSATVSNARDATGRYRGSSFDVFDDGNARTHLCNDIVAQAYPCCL